MFGLIGAQIGLGNCRHAFEIGERPDVAGLESGLPASACDRTALDPRPSASPPEFCENQRVAFAGGIVSRCPIPIWFVVRRPEGRIIAAARRPSARGYHDGCVVADPCLRAPDLGDDPLDSVDEVLRRGFRVEDLANAKRLELGNGSGPNHAAADDADVERRALRATP